MKLEYSTMTVNVISSRNGLPVPKANVEYDVMRLASSNNKFLVKMNLFVKMGVSDEYGKLSFCVPNGDGTIQIGKLQQNYKADNAPVEVTMKIDAEGKNPSPKDDTDSDSDIDNTKDNTYYFLAPDNWFKTESGALNTDVGCYIFGTSGDTGNKDYSIWSGKKATPAPEVHPNAFKVVLPKAQDWFFLIFNAYVNTDADRSNKEIIKAAHQTVNIDVEENICSNKIYVLALDNENTAFIDFGTYKGTPTYKGAWFGLNEFKSSYNYSTYGLSDGKTTSPSGSAEETTDEIINYTSALVTPSAAQYVVSKSADKQYSGLVSRGRYIFMLVKSESADNLASSDNLVYINQFTADENGVLNFDYPDSYADEYTALIFGGKTTDEAAEFTFDAETEKNNIMGDVDGDGSVTSADALLILRMSVDLEEITDENKPYADIDGDDSVSAADSLEVLRYSVGLSLNENIGKKVA